MKMESNAEMQKMHKFRQRYCGVPRKGLGEESQLLS